MTKTTPLQQAIFEELEKYTSTEIMRDNAQTIANNVAKRDEIASCSKTYVMRMIKRTEDSSARVQFKVEPPKSEDEEILTAEETESKDESFALDPYDNEDSDDWDFDDEPSEEEEESETSDDTPKKKSIKDTSIEELINVKAAKTLIVVPFRMIADFTGYEGFKLTAEEEKELVPVVRPLLIKYLPDVLEGYLPEVICVIVVLGVLAPKVKGYQEFQEDKKKSAIAQAKAEKSAAEAEERESRRLEIEKQEQLAALARPPEIEPAPAPTKDDPANTPKWLSQRGNIG